MTEEPHDHDHDQDEQLPDLVVAGTGDDVIEVYEEEDGWSVWIGDDELGEHAEWRDAFADAVRRGQPDPTITGEDDEPVILAELHAADGVIWIIRVGDAEYQAVMELHDDDVAHELEGTFPSLEDAVLEIAAGLFGEADPG